MPQSRSTPVKWIPQRTLIGNAGTPLPEIAPSVRPKLCRADYQVQGAGQKVCEAVWDPDACSDPRKRIEDALGELAFFLITYEPPKPEPKTHLFGTMTAGEFDARLHQLGAKIAAGVFQPVTRLIATTP